MKLNERCRIESNLFSQRLAKLDFSTAQRFIHICQYLDVKR